MPHEIRVPRLGWSMEEGKFISWLKRPGEAVAAGEALFELEGEKALQEIESLDAGALAIPEGSPEPGSVVLVGQLLGYLLLPGEQIPDQSDAPGEEQEGSTIVEVEALDRGPRKPTTTTSSPRARRVAAELGVDWTTLGGTGRWGRVRESDVRAAAAGVNAPAAPSPEGGRQPIVVGPKHVRTSPRRKAIAERLRLGRDRAIPVTITTVADATNLVGLREQFKASGQRIVPSYTDIMACLVARAFKSHPHIAARWESDHETLVQAGGNGVHIGVAVDTPEGLLVPVVRDVGRKSLMEVATASRGLIDLARSGRLSADAMRGGVFTITNLGAFGIDAFTPIINEPEVAILGLGAVRREPCFSADGRVVPRDRMVLSLTFDHAAVDGAPAAAFLRDLSASIANAAACLIASD